MLDLTVHAYCMQMVLALWFWQLYSLRRATCWFWVFGIEVANSWHKDSQIDCICVYYAGRTGMFYHDAPEEGV